MDLTNDNFFEITFYSEDSTNNIFNPPSEETVCIAWGTSLPTELQMIEEIRLKRPELKNIKIKILSYIRLDPTLYYLRR